MVSPCRLAPHQPPGPRPAVPPSSHRAVVDAFVAECHQPAIPWLLLLLLIVEPAPAPRSPAATGSCPLLETRFGYDLYLPHLRQIFGCLLQLFPCSLQLVRLKLLSFCASLYSVLQASSKVHVYSVLEHLASR